jgi:hypothetical protein
MFKGETLRGLLLNAYAFGTMGTIAGIAAIAAFIGGRGDSCCCRRSACGTAVASPRPRRPCWRTATSPHCRGQLILSAGPSIAAMEDERRRARTGTLICG